MPQGILARIRSMFEGDPGIRRVANDPVLSAELLLLFRMMLADGEVSETEMAVLRQICKDSFDIPESSMDGVIAYLNEFGYETSGVQAVAMFRDMPVERRRELARHMAEIAKADSRLDTGEMRLLKRTLDMLGLGGSDPAPTQEPD